MVISLFEECNYFVTLYFTNNQPYLAGYKTDPDTGGCSSIGLSTFMLDCDIFFLVYLYCLINSQVKTSSKSV